MPTYPSASQQVSYWQQQTPLQSISKPVTTQHYDVAIIGAGYTGMRCALSLANEHQQKVLLLDANQLGFGCSGRNAGFVLFGAGRLGYGDYARKYGLDVAKQLFAEHRQAVNGLQPFAQQVGIDLQAQQPGYLKIAHKANQVPLLAKAAEFYQTQLDFPAELLAKEQLHQQVMAHQQGFGALRLPECYGLNPLQLCNAYIRHLQQSTVEIADNCAVHAIRQTSDGQRLDTALGQFTADKVVVAGNGYTPLGFHPATHGRLLPILSTVIVTQAFTPTQLAAAGLHSEQVMMDTRALKYYYRLLPNGRILLGGRGAITGRTAEDPIYVQRLLAALRTALPGLGEVRADYSWSGWIAAALDDMPHLGQCASGAPVYYSGGYCGSAVSYSFLAGQRLAQKVMGQSLPDLPVYQTPLPKFPLPALRRVGQWGYYQWGRFKDYYL